MRCLFTCGFDVADCPWAHCFPFVLRFNFERNLLILKSRTIKFYRKKTIEFSWMHLITNNCTCARCPQVWFVNRLRLWSTASMRTVCYVKIISSMHCTHTHNSTCMWYVSVQCIRMFYVRFWQMRCVKCLFWFSNRSQIGARCMNWIKFRHFALFSYGRRKLSITFGTACQTPDKSITEINFIRK